MEIDHQSATPVYVQLAALLRGMIETGEVAADRPLPSIKTLTQRYGVASGSVEHALALLKAEGLVKGVKGKGIYVV